MYFLFGNNVKSSIFAKNRKRMQQILLTLSMLITQGKTLTEDQIQSIQRILWGVIDPTVTAPQFTPQKTPDAPPELVYGLAGLAAFFGVSIPTACRYRERYEGARVRFGGRKLVWDKAKLLELAKKNNKW